MKVRLFYCLSIFFAISMAIHGESVKLKTLFKDLKTTVEPQKRIEVLFSIVTEIKGSYPDSAAHFFNLINTESQKLPFKEQKIIEIRLNIGRAQIEIAKGNYDAGWHFDSLALVQAKTEKNLEQQAIATMGLGNIFYYRSQFDKAQEYNNEALRLNRQTKDWKTEAKILTNMGTIEFMFGNFSKAESLFVAPLTLAQKMKDDDILAANYMNLGLLQNYMGKYPDATQNITKAAEIYKSIDGKDGLVLCYENLSNVALNQGDLSMAIEYGLLNQKVAIEIGDKAGISKALQNLGEFYMQLGDYEKAMENYLQTLKIKEELGDPRAIAATGSSIGNINYMQGDYKNAMSYYSKSLKIYSDVGYVLGIANSLADIGNVLVEQNNADSALICYQKSIENYEKIKNKNPIANVLMNIGRIYAAKKNFAIATEYYTKAEVIKTEIDDKLGIYNAWVLIAQMHLNESKLLQRGSAKQLKELNDALNYALKAYNLSNKSGLLPGQRESAALLVDIYDSLGNKSEALKFAKINIERTDSLNKVQRAEALVNAEARWKAEKRQAAIDKLTEEKELQNRVIEQKSKLTARLYMIMALILIAFIAVIVSAMLYIKNKKKQKDLEYQTHMSEITSLKMQNIQNRLSPHLFFNVIGSVAGQADEPELVRKKLGDMATLLRKSLENTEKTAIPLEDELELVKSFVSLQTTRLPQPFSVAYAIDDAIDLKTLIPSMMLQIPVENAIKHGLMPMDGLKSLQIAVKKQNERVVLCIEDNGIGREKSKGRTAGTGTGLKVLLQTIRLLNSHNKLPISFNVEDKAPQGTIVTIEIPLDYSYILQN